MALPAFVTTYHSFSLDCFVIIVSSIIPPFSLSKTESVDVYGAREFNDDGVKDIKKACDVGPVKRC